MATTTANMSLSKPDEGADTDVWDTSLNDSLDLIDAHDHSSGNGVQIPTAGIGIDADLDFGGYSLENLKFTAFAEIATASADTVNSFFVDDGDSELYWRNASGTNIQISNGSGLDITVNGGIVGDYGSGDEEVNYDNANSRYEFLADDSPETKAGVDCGDLRLFEESASITNSVTLKSPASLAAAYVLTMPAALPGSDSLPVIDTAGDIAYDASGLTPTFTGLNITDRDIAHGSRELLIPLCAFAASAAITDIYISDAPSVSNSLVFDNSTAVRAHFPIVLPVGKRITSIGFQHENSAAQFTLSLVSRGSGGLTTHWTTTATATDSTALTGTAVTMAADTFYEILVQLTSGTDKGLERGIVVTYDEQ